MEQKSTEERVLVSLIEMCEKSESGRRRKRTPTPTGSPTPKPTLSPSEGSATSETSASGTSETEKPREVSFVFHGNDDLSSEQNSSIEKVTEAPECNGLSEQDGTILSEKWGDIEMEKKRNTCCKFLKHFSIIDVNHHLVRNLD